MFFIAFCTRFPIIRVNRYHFKRSSSRFSCVCVYCLRSIEAPTSCSYLSVELNVYFAYMATGYGMQMIKRGFFHKYLWIKLKDRAWDGIEHDSKPISSSCVHSNPVPNRYISRQNIFHRNSFSSANIILSVRMLHTKINFLEHFSRDWCLTSKENRRGINRKDPGKLTFSILGVRVHAQSPQKPGENVLLINGNHPRWRSTIWSSHQNHISTRKGATTRRSTLWRSNVQPHRSNIIKACVFGAPIFLFISNCWFWSVQ